ncbi:MAG: hypothetical protein JW703_01080, partial [Candidatus Diapherotrites archaeon]|nr:hypothetical protein [Candidatus Diapherotrites archaeon]
GKMGFNEKGAVPAVLIILGILAVFGAIWAGTTLANTVKEMQSGTNLIEVSTLSNEQLKTTINSPQPIAECSSTGINAIEKYGFDKLLFQWTKEQIQENVCDSPDGNYCDETQFEIALKKKLELIPKIKTELASRVAPETEPEEYIKFLAEPLTFTVDNIDLKFFKDSTGMPLTDITNTETNRATLGNKLIFLFPKPSAELLNLINKKEYQEVTDSDGKTLIAITYGTFTKLGVTAQVAATEKITESTSNLNESESNNSIEPEKETIYLEEPFTENPETIVINSLEFTYPAIPANNGGSIIECTKTNNTSATCTLKTNIKINATEQTINNTKFNSAIIINTNNITLNCNGNSITTETVNADGITNLGTNTTIQNCEIRGKSDGIYNKGTITTIEKNTITGNDDGIYNEGTIETITNNTITGNDDGIYNEGTIEKIENNTKIKGINAISNGYCKSCDIKHVEATINSIIGNTLTSTDASNGYAIVFSNKATSEKPTISNNTCTGKAIWFKEKAEEQAGWCKSDTITTPHISGDSPSLKLYSFIANTSEVIVGIEFSEELKGETNSEKAEYVMQNAELKQDYSLPSKFTSFYDAYTNIFNQTVLLKKTSGFAETPGTYNAKIYFKTSEKRKPVNDVFVELKKTNNNFPEDYAKNKLFFMDLTPSTDCKENCVPLSEFVGEGISGTMSNFVSGTVSVPDITSNKILLIGDKLTLTPSIPFTVQANVTANKENAWLLFEYSEGDTPSNLIQKAWNEWKTSEEITQTSGTPAANKEKDTQQAEQSQENETPPKDSPQIPASSSDSFTSNETIVIDGDYANLSSKTNGAIECTRKVFGGINCELKKNIELNLNAEILDAKSSIRTGIRILKDNTTFECNGNQIILKEHNSANYNTYGSIILNNAQGTEIKNRIIQSPDEISTGIINGGEIKLIEKNNITAKFGIVNSVKIEEIKENEFNNETAIYNNCVKYKAEYPEEIGTKKYAVGDIIQITAEITNIEKNKINATKTGILNKSKIKRIKENTIDAISGIYNEKGLDVIPIINKITENIKTGKVENEDGIINEITKNKEIYINFSTENSNVNERNETIQPKISENECTEDPQSDNAKIKTEGWCISKAEQKELTEPSIIEFAETSPNEPSTSSEETIVIDEPIKLATYYIYSLSKYKYNAKTKKGWKKETNNFIYYFNDTQVFSCDSEGNCILLKNIKFVLDDQDIITYKINEVQNPIIYGLYFKSPNHLDCKNKKIELNYTGTNSYISVNATVFNEGMSSLKNCIIKNNYNEIGVYSRDAKGSNCFKEVSNCEIETLIMEKNDPGDDYSKIQNNKINLIRLITLTDAIPNFTNIFGNTCKIPPTINNIPQSNKTNSWCSEITELNECEKNKFECYDPEKYNCSNKYGLFTNYGCPEGQKCCEVKVTEKNKPSKEGKGTDNHTESNPTNKKSSIAEVTPNSLSDSPFTIVFNKQLNVCRNEKVDDGVQALKFNSITGTAFTVFYLPLNDSMQRVLMLRGANETAKITLSKYAKYSNRSNEFTIEGCKSAYVSVKSEKKQLKDFSLEKLIEKVNSGEICINETQQGLEFAWNEGKILGVQGTQTPQSLVREMEETQPIEETNNTDGEPQIQKEKSNTGETIPTSTIPEQTEITGINFTISESKDYFIKAIVQKITIDPFVKASIEFSDNGKAQEIIVSENAELTLINPQIQKIASPANTGITVLDSAKLIINGTGIVSGFDNGISLNNAEAEIAGLKIKDVKIGIISNKKLTLSSVTTENVETGIDAQGELIVLNNSEIKATETGISFKGTDLTVKNSTVNSNKKGIILLASTTLPADYKLNADFENSTIQGYPNDFYLQGLGTDYIEVKNKATCTDVQPLIGKELLCTPLQPVESKPADSEKIYFTEAETRNWNIASNKIRFYGFLSECKTYSVELWTLTPKEALLDSDKHLNITRENSRDRQFILELFTEKPESNDFTVSLTDEMKNKFDAATNTLTDFRNSIQTIYTQNNLPGITPYVVLSCANEVEKEAKATWTNWTDFIYGVYYTESDLTLRRCPNAETANTLTECFNKYLEEAVKVEESETASPSLTLAEGEKCTQIQASTIKLEYASDDKLKTMELPNWATISNNKVTIDLSQIKDSTIKINISNNTKITVTSKDNSTNITVIDFDPPEKVFADEEEIIEKNKDIEITYSDSSNLAEGKSSSVINFDETEATGNLFERNLINDVAKFETKTYSVTVYSTPKYPELSNCIKIENMKIAVISTENAKKLDSEKYTVYNYPAKITVNNEESNVPQKISIIVFSKNMPVPLNAKEVNFTGDAIICFNQDADNTSSFNSNNVTADNKSVFDLPANLKKSMNFTKITMFTTNGCTVCDKLGNYFNSKGIQFEIRKMTTAQTYEKAEPLAQYLYNTTTDAQLKNYMWPKGYGYDRDAPELLPPTTVFPSENKIIIGFYEKK